MLPAKRTVFVSGSRLTIPSASSESLSASAAADGLALSAAARCSSVCCAAGSARTSACANRSCSPLASPAAAEATAASEIVTAAGRRADESFHRITPLSPSECTDVIVLVLEFSISGSTCADRPYARTARSVFGSERLSKRPIGGQSFATSRQSATGRSCPCNDRDRVAAASDRAFPSGGDPPSRWQRRSCEASLFRR